MKTYKIRISGSGTPDEIIQALRDIITTMNSELEDGLILEGPYEDATLYTEIDLQTALDRQLEKSDVPQV